MVAKPVGLRRSLRATAALTEQTGQAWDGSASGSQAAARRQSVRSAGTRRRGRRLRHRPRRVWHTALGILVYNRPIQLAKLNPRVPLEKSDLYQRARATARRDGKVIAGSGAPPMREAVQLAA